MIEGEFFSEEDFDQSLYDKTLQLVKKRDQPAEMVVNLQTGISYIHTAAWWNDDELLEHILKFKLDINFPDAKGRTALMVAAQKGHVTVFEKLLKLGANMNQQSDNGVTALGFALHFKHKVILERCIEFGANLNFTDFEGNTFLHKACKQGCLSEVATIERHGVDVNHRNSAGLTPLMISCQQGKLDVVKYLVTRGSDVHAKCKECMSAFEYAFLTDCEEIVQYMRIKSKEPSNEQGTKLIFTCKVQDLQLLSNLLHQGENPNVKDPAKRWCSLLHIAVSVMNRGMVKLLIHHGANVNETNIENRTPLFEACLMGDEMIVSFLLECGANTNIRDEEERSPLMCACQSGSIVIVKMLLQNGALQSFKDKTGRSALCHATKHGHRDIVKLFWEIGQVNVDIRDITGRTCLSVAASRSDFEMLDLFLCWGADINCQDKNLTTPLMVAVINNNFSIVKYLIEHGARIDIYDNIGINVVQLAQVKGNENIRTYLEAKALPQEFLEQTRVLQLRKFYTDISSDTSGRAQHELFDMCKNGWLFPDLVKYTIEKGADINCKTSDGFSPILLLCSNNNLKHIEALLQHEPQINCQDPEGWSPLMYAVKHNHLTTVQLLLSNGADVNLQENQGKTALMLAFENQRSDIVECLLRVQTIDIQCKDIHGETTISYCKKYNAVEDILHMVVEKDKQCLNIGESCQRKDIHGETTISYCKKYNAGEDILNMVVEKDKQCLNICESCQCKVIHGETTISYCKKYNAGENSLNMVVEKDKQCLNTGESYSEMTHCPPENYETKFLEACSESNLAEIQILVQYYKEYSMETIEKCLTLLTWNSDLDTLMWLSSVGIDIFMEFGKGENILYAAIKMNNFSLVESLLEMQQTNAAHISKEGWTPAMVAIDTHDCDVSLVVSLLANERKVNFGVGNCMPVLWALKKGVYEIFHYIHNLRSYDKICKDCTNANQKDYILI